MRPTPAAHWFVAAGAEAGSLYRAWSGGEAAAVPIGRLWDVVRVTTRLGYDVLGRARGISAEIGPVLETPARGALEILVAPGTAASWPRMIGTRAAATGYMRCPPPHVTVASGLRSTGERRWIVPPLYAPATTDADALCEAVAAALMHRTTAATARSRDELA